MSEDAGEFSFASRLLRWFDQHGRHDLPWLHPRTPYRVWLSEVMLQQTQVVTVIGYFQRFVDRFPDVHSLAAASIDEVLALWSGLGYYSRARNLHAAAQSLVEQHAGEMPQTFDSLMALPGIGRSTAAAILAQAFDQRAAILDGNVRRVMARQTGEVLWPGLPKVQARLWLHAEHLLPATRMADYTQALMDLGATLCTPRRPACLLCPVQLGCVAYESAQVGQIPVARPKRVIPTRQRHWLLLRDTQQRIRLERRPPSGIWGGLYALPEAAELSELLERFELTAEQLRALPQVEHSFTHFKLQALVWTASMPQSRQLREAANEHWCAPQAASALGLPAPVRRLLAELPCASSVVVIDNGAY
jgi:A/G-specific adenine glycosylase